MLLTRGCSSDTKQIERNLLGWQGNGSVQKYSASNASFAEILCRTQTIENEMTKISEKTKPNWHSWKMMPLTWQSQKRRHWVVARPWVSFMYTQGKHTKQELWNLHILWWLIRRGYLHIQDPMSTCAPGARGHAGQNCQTPKKKVTIWSLLLLVNQTHHLHHEWQWLVAITPH